MAVDRVIDFAVQGSAVLPYRVRFHRAGDDFTSSCTCPAGLMGQNCKHRLALLAGDAAAVVGGVHAEVGEIAKMLVGSPAAAAMRELAVAEKVVVAARQEERRRRLALARILCVLPTALAIVLLIESVAIEARAGELPTYQVETYCRKIAGFGGNYSETIMSGCLEMEQSSYNNLKSAWKALPERIQQHCNKIASFGGNAGYTLLEGCVQMEENAAKSNAEFRFQR